MKNFLMISNNLKQTNMRYSWYYKIPMIATLVALVVLALGLLIKSLWNLLIPELFGGPVITYWQAIGLFILSKILLHTFGFGHFHGHRRNFHHWKARMEERMASMTPEERDKFKEEWSRRCRPGYWHHNFEHGNMFKEEKI
jgi:uncharacterized protein YacL